MRDINDEANFEVRIASHFFCKRREKIGYWINHEAAHKHLPLRLDEQGACHCGRVHYRNAMHIRATEDEKEIPL